MIIDKKEHTLTMSILKIIILIKEEKMYFQHLIKYL